MSLNNLRKEVWAIPYVFETVVEQVYEGLQFAHRLGIYHLDVRPSNIIVQVDKTGMPKVMLSDWGCASREKKLKKFRGCTPYAHDLLLGKMATFNVKTNPALDFASLVFTIFDAVEGKLPWLSKFDRPTTVLSSDKDERRDFVNQWFQVNETMLPEACREALKKAVLPRGNVKRSADGSFKKN